MPKAQRRLLITGLVLLDIVTVTLALLAARWLVSPQGEGDWFLYPWLPLMSVVVATMFFAINRLYVLDELFEGPVEYGRVVYACTLTTFAVSVVGFWGREIVVGPPSRRLIALTWLLSILAVGGGRFVARRVVRALRRRGYLVSRALIVGLGAAGISLARNFRSMRHTGMDVVGFIDDYLPPGTPVTDGLKVLGPPSALPRILHETGATEVIVVPTAMAWESFRDLIRSTSGLNGHAVRLALDFLDLLPTSVKVHRFGFTPLLTIERIRITGLDAVMKWVLDYGTALVLMPVTLSLVALLGGALLLTGVRPFQSLRVIGREGVAFRTFLLNVSEPRNRVQRLIYHLGLDKLPQFLNVLMGQMSIVGPRPVRVDQRSEYERWIPNLLTVKPGITGLWVVRGMPASLEDEMQLNLFYTRNYSIWLDLDILARSLIRLLGGRSVSEGGKEAVARERLTVHGESGKRTGTSNG
jgi:lipopolysaccharide/colanic/teichoic acid biosynthesis glycosyltransferase